MIRSLTFFILLTLFVPGCGDRLSMSASSMEPTISKGETITINRGAYSKGGPRRWDVIVFTHPETKKPWVARIVGLPGETIDIRAEGVFIGDRLQVQPENIKSIKYLPQIPGIPTKVSLPHVIASGEYFFLGDNSSAARDSRYSGTVPLSSIIGRVNGK